jgi:hypothetical protein
MPPKDFKCNRCGKCCLNLYDALTICAAEEDAQLWIREGGQFILDWVDPIPIGGGQFVPDIWINPNTHDDVPRCPWLRKLPNKDKYICRIHDVNPKY